MHNSHTLGPRPVDQQLAKWQPLKPTHIPAKIIIQKYHIPGEWKKINSMLKNAKHKEQ